MTGTTYTAADIIAAFKRLETANPGKSITRDKFRKESGIPTSAWEREFGTFAELRRQAGGAPTQATNKLLTNVAKHTAAKKYEELNKEREEYGEQYLRSDPGRYKTLLVGTDLHDKEIDPFVLRVFLDTAKRVQPETVVLGGDVFDLPEFGRYGVDPREWDVVGRIKFAHDNILEPLRNNVPDAQIDLIEGNHECVTPSTEILTDHGWVRAGAITRDNRVASWNNAGGLSYDRPIAVASQDNRELYEISSAFKTEHVTDNHRVFYDGKLTAVSDLPKKIDGSKFLNALPANGWGERMDENLVRFAVWVITRGTIRRDVDDTFSVQFQGIPRRIERRVKGVVQKIKGIKWIKEPGGVSVAGPGMGLLIDVITGRDDHRDNTQWRKVPDWFEGLHRDYGKIVAGEMNWLAKIPFASSTSYLKTSSKEFADEMQLFLCLRDVPCAYSTLGHDEYLLCYNERNKLEKFRGKHVRLRKLDNGRVVSIQTKNGTLITRLNGKVNFTGNCRLVKHLADFSPATRAILGDLHGMTIGDLFGLGKFKINYVAKADLRSYTSKEHAKELENNYRIYHDTFMVHHFPHARHMGVPGVNGHHHAHISWPMFNVHQGAYEWHQLGAMHRRSASYCEGERWHNGFSLVHIDTVTKQVNIEYVPVTDFAVVGGKFYSREASEIVLMEGMK